MRCNFCHKDKDNTAFYPYSKTKCKECHHNYYLKNKDKISKYSAQWSKNNLDRHRASNKKYREGHREQIRAYYKEWYDKNHRRREPLKDAARNMITTALRHGMLERPLNCTKCQAKGRIEGHHPDYMKPLDVIWLCQSCHRTIHP